jgi:uncharacterized membrane protein YesL
MDMALRAIGSAIAQVFTHVSAAILSNIASILLAIPLLIVLGILAYPTGSWSVIPIGSALLIGVLPNPAALVVQSVARELAHDEDISVRRQLRSIRPLVFPTLKCWLVSVFVTAFIVASLTFYSRSTLPIAGSLELVWLLGLWIWLSINLYVFPLILDQDRKTVLAVYRNAAVMVMARPLVTFTTTLVWLAVLVLTCSTGLATFIGLALAAAIQQNTFVRLVPTFTRVEA